MRISPIKTRREELRLTQEEAARAAGLSLSTWTRIENGKELNPSQATTRAIGVAMEWEDDWHERLRAGHAPTVTSPEPVTNSDSNRASLAIVGLSSDEYSLLHSLLMMYRALQGRR